MLNTRWIAVAAREKEEENFAKSKINKYQLLLLDLNCFDNDLDDDKVSNKDKIDIKRMYDAYIAGTSIKDLAHVFQTRDALQFQAKRKNIPFPKYLSARWIYEHSKHMPLNPSHVANYFEEAARYKLDTLKRLSELSPELAAQDRIHFDNELTALEKEYKMVLGSAAEETSVPPVEQTSQKNRKEKLIPMSGFELKKLFEKLGFVFVRYTGDHAYLKHPNGRAASVPQHTELSLWTSREIIKRSGCTEKQIMDLYYGRTQ